MSVRWEVPVGRKVWEADWWYPRRRCLYFVCLLPAARYGDPGVELVHEY